MKATIEATDTVPRHEVEVVCHACGFDLDEHELEADTCSDCGAPLNLRKSMSIHVTTLAAAGAKTLGE